MTNSNYTDSHNARYVFRPLTRKKQIESINLHSFTQTSNISDFLSYDLDSPKIGVVVTIAILKKI